MVPISVVSLSSCVIHARSLDLCLDFLTYNKMGLLGMGFYRIWDNSVLFQKDELPGPEGCISSHVVYGIHVYQCILYPSKGVSIICHGVSETQEPKVKKVWEMLGQSKSSKIL